MTTNQLVAQIETIWTLDASAPAVEFKGHWISWGELREGALAVDRALSAAGIGTGAAVGVLLRNRPGLLAALVGILVSERCIISLSPFQPPGALHRELRELRLPAIIADAEDWAAEGTVELALELGVLGLSLDDRRRFAVETVSPYSPDEAHHASLPGTAVEILSSGTTGAPKRIRISYGTLQDSIMDGAVGAKNGSARAITLKAMPTILAAPLLHVSGMFGALLPICEGRPLVLLEKFEVGTWVDAVAKHKIKFASLPPTPMRMILDAGVAKEKLASLIAVRAGTAPLPVDTQRQFESKYGIPVLVQYGATEWMGGIAGWTLDEHKKYIATKLGSVGRPRGGVKLRVVDPDTHSEVATGQMGILEVLPHQRLDTSEWMRTTDLASIDDDGFLYIHGRADDTIIRGGFKVLLSHVADVLARHASVLDAAVIGLPDPRLGQVPVAAIELRPGAAVPTSAELAAFARLHLAPYAVPVQFKIVETLPRTISMKVIRPAIKALFLSEDASPPGPAASQASIEPLFQPLVGEVIALRNRFAMSPMTRAFSPNGVPDPKTPDYYARRAAGGAGLIITEGAAPPHPVAHHSANIPNFYGEALPVWGKVADAVHAAGSKIFVQLWHAGLGRRPAETLNPHEPSVGPSGYLPDGHHPARTMDEKDIADVIEAFATAAESAKQTGFDGIEIHGAHGYIVDQFFWKRTNLRTDRYNGDIEERGRFGVELVRAIRARVGANMPIMLRWSQWKGPDYDAKLVENPAELARFLEPLVDAGVDMFDCSTRRFWLPEFAGSPLNLAGWTKKITGKVTMTVGSIGLEAPLSGRRMDTITSSEVSLANLSTLMEMFNRGDFDLVALGRSFLMNPQWPRLVRERLFEDIRVYDHQLVAKYLECADAPPPPPP